MRSTNELIRATGLRAVTIAMSLAWLAGAAVAQSPSAQMPSASASSSQGPFAELQYRHIGPVGNRVTSVAGVAGDPSIVFAGAASGGVFRSTDGGVHWQPVFDDTGAFSIGSIAVAPSDPNVVWVGTGETFIRSNVTLGDGIYRSTDGGESWQRRGLEKTGRIGRLAIDPRDPDVVFAAALGHAYGPQPERGVYRTRDGGESWERVLFVDEKTGAIDVVMDPNNPRILFAATWQIEIWTAGRTSGGPGSGIYKSVDGGDTWARLDGNGLPAAPLGKIGLAMTAADSRRVYALIETSSNQEFAPFDDFAGVLWRSDDRGASWSMVNADNTLTQRPLYYTRAVASPDDRDEITFMAVQQSISTDGGVTIRRQNSGWDHHDLWIDPLDPDRRIAGHDGGVSITVNRGETWARPLLPNAQMYHVATDTRVPYRVYGNRQDGPTAAGPSNTLSGRTIPIGAWREVGGCEVGFSIPDPNDPDVVWSGCYDGQLERYDGRTGQARDVSVWPLAVESWAAEDLDYRVQWNAPLALSPHDSKTVYYGSQYVHRTTDEGQSWQLISPDLTTADPELMQRTGGLTLDDAGPTIAPTVFAIAESPLTAGEIWAGTNDGQVQVTRDGGASWSNVTANIPGLPPLGTVTIVEPSHHAAGRAYLTVDRHQEGDTEPYLYRTDDHGRTWRSLRSDLPGGVTAYAHCLREDPQVPGLLYLGTESTVWVSLDDGREWLPLASGLPPVPVHWIEVQQQFGDLVLATYGRGFWILDDLSAVRQMASERGQEAGDPVLYQPRAAYRFRGRAAAWSEEYSAAAGTNPEYGATLHYRLHQDVEEPVSLRIESADGAPVRTLEGLSQQAGLHRTTWDLRGERTSEVQLRTIPDENHGIELPARRWRELSDGGRIALLAPPGAYRLLLRVGEDEVASRQLTVVKDPASSGGEVDIAAQMELLRPLHEALNTAAEMLNGSEWLRRQVADLRAVWDESAQSEPSAAADGDGGDLEAAFDSLEEQLEAFESAFFDLRLTGARQDTLRWERRLYARLGYLAWMIGKTDHRPTDAQQRVFDLLLGQLEEQSEAWREIVEAAVPELNRAAAESGLELLTVVDPSPVGASTP